MRYISGSEPETLDPQCQQASPKRASTLRLYDGLTEYHPETGQPIPSIAERWEPNSDNSEFTFHLREAKWSNGDLITAHDFVYSLRRGRRPGVRRTFRLPGVLHRKRAGLQRGQGKAEDVGVTRLTIAR